MAQLDYTQALRPQLLSDVARLTTPGIALDLAREFGGRSIYFPRRIGSAHQISRCIGFKAAERLCREWGGEERLVPAATTHLRWLDARALRLLGCKNDEIALRLRISERHLRHLLRGFDPAEHEIDDMVRAIGKLYRVRAPAAPPERWADSLQWDFGWPHEAGGMRFKFA